MPPSSVFWIEQSGFTGQCVFLAASLRINIILPFRFRIALPLPETVPGNEWNYNGLYVGSSFFDCVGRIRDVANVILEQLDTPFIVVFLGTT